MRDSNVVASQSSRVLRSITDMYFIAKTRYLTNQLMSFYDRYLNAA